MLALDANKALLVLVVEGSAPVVRGILNQMVHVRGRRAVVQVRPEPGRQGSDDLLWLAAKAGQVLVAVGRHLNQVDDLLVAPAQGHEHVHAQAPEAPEAGRPLAAQQLHPLLRQLEGRPLEVRVARRPGEHEPEVDVDGVALGVQEDVPVVPVLQVEQVAQDGVRAQALHEAVPRLDEPGGPLVPEAALEEVQQRGELGVVALEGVDADGVRHGLDHAAAAARGQDVVRPHVHRQGRVPQDLRHLLHELAGEHLLAQVVVGLDDHGHQPPAGQVPD
eukprot:CAMPEP_0194576286 /NCGR_PEP_ID=MMETSP0292-20121207/11459_1 /TAXON_ID=39354 /ORGANISM="Heterosigma akashiwo, Strain CCMP2393" /LENGTH=275 /DNA_ID=CAMNT_0039428299 /DNA_START=410 /DNA_END=1234 /DNA_ORIENTATION=-